MRAGGVLGDQRLIDRHHAAESEPGQEAGADEKAERAGRPATPVKTENISTVAANTTRRPQRSATQPQHQEPMPIPANAEEPTRPTCVGVRRELLPDSAARSRRW